MPTSSTDFLQQLQDQAAVQAKIRHSQILPSQLSGVAAFIGNYPWQTLVISSGVVAGIWTFLLHL